MRAKSSIAKKPAEQVVKDIRRATRMPVGDGAVRRPPYPDQSYLSGEMRTQLLDCWRRTYKAGIRRTLDFRD